MRQSSATLDVMFELLDRKLLIGDNAFHHIANRNDTRKFIIFEHREMAYGFCRHDGHAFFNRLIKPRANDCR